MRCCGRAKDEKQTLSRMRMRVDATLHGLSYGPGASRADTGILSPSGALMRALQILSCLATASAVRCYSAALAGRGGAPAGARAPLPVCSCSVDRRSAVLGGLAAAMGLPQAASAIVESNNPANNYYFPMAKYRYLPRILRAWIAVDELAPAAIEVGDWDGMDEVIRRADDAVTALPLYTSAVEGSRSTKRKRKSETQKQMTEDLQVYTKALENMKKSVAKKDRATTEKLLKEVRSSLLDYRQLAQIDGPDGGVVTIPLGNAEESGHAGAPLGYVIPAFRGGGTSMDYALRPGEPMMQGGMIRQDYREKYQKNQQ
ncbi:hypothetical protein AB1Y20_012976 [Prymnesium parvum]|uniref:Uncharacterized protein n=1 Tax=Prymnesium parvum TaxID=97485 RepID=A0AB34IJX0_PRYPA